MGRFNASEIDNYGNSNNASYFGLKNDGDIARVRFMYDGLEDVAAYAVHEVEVDGKRRYVNCLRDYNDHMDKCPLCASHNFQRVKFYIPVYDLDTGTVKIWERGKRFYGKIAGLCARYPHLVSQQFEIERHGKPGDTSTTYEIFPVGQPDGTTLEDLPEIPNVLGTIILDKNADELASYVSTGTFGAGTSYDEIPTRRESARQPIEGRRTPERRRGEAF